MSDPIPDYLREVPGGTFPAPPVDTAEQLLPVDALTWENFERLCFRLASVDGTPEHVTLYGVRGQTQGGIDIYSRLTSGTYVTYQCKRYAKFDQAHLDRAVAEFEQGAWRSTSTRFVLCVSTSAVRTQVADAIERHARRLRESRPSVHFVVWDAEALSARLKNHADLVLDFFGAAWADRFVRAQTPEDPATAVAEELAARMLLENWALWTEGLFEPTPRIHEDDSERLDAVQAWLVGHLADDSTAVRAALLNFERVLADFQLILHYEMDDRNGSYWVSRFYRSWSGRPGRAAQVGRFQAHVALIYNLAAELARAMNLVIDRARHDGSSVLQRASYAVCLAGPENQPAVTPRYTDAEASALQPYPGLDAFPAVLTHRDGNFGAGSTGTGTAIGMGDVRAGGPGPRKRPSAALTRVRESARDPGTGLPPLDGLDLRSAAGFHAPRRYELEPAPAAARRPRR